MNDKYIQEKIEDKATLRIKIAPIEKLFYLKKLKGAIFILSVEIHIMAIQIEEVPKISQRCFTFLIENTFYNVTYVCIEGVIIQ